MTNATIDEFKKNAKSVLDECKKELGGIRTNRPNTSLVEEIKVSYYDQMTPIKHLGSVGVTPPREIHIQVWDKGAVQAVSKAIETSSLGLSPKIDGMVVRVYLPELSEERRVELVKYAKKISEESRINVRRIRDDANKQIQKSFDDSEIGEDERFSLREEIQKNTDKTNEEIDSMLDGKIKEIQE